MYLPHMALTDMLCNQATPLVEVMAVNGFTIKQMQFAWLGQLMLETMQHCAVFSHDPHGCRLPIRKDLYDAMLCGDFTRLLGVVHADENRSCIHAA